MISIQVIPRLYKIKIINPKPLYLIIQQIKIVLAMIVFGQYLALAIFRNGKA